ncbi:MAG: hypothetical protein H7222_09630 [Methylotenera sp.]|nr:hypothetical protein [Oligoflexia bacterium]
MPQSEPQRYQPLPSYSQSHSSLNSVNSAWATSQKSPAISASALFLGALVGMAVLMLLSVLGMALGLSLFNFQRDGFPGSILDRISIATFISFSLCTAYGLGGYVSSRASHSDSHWDSIYRSLGTWALNIVLLGFFVAAIGSWAAGFLAQAGYNLGSDLGKTSVIDQITHNLGEMKIMTNLSVLKGKAETRFVPGPTHGGIAAQAGKEMKSHAKMAKKSGVVSESLEVKGESARKTALPILWLTFAAILLSAAAAVFGGLHAVKMAGMNR